MTLTIPTWVLYTTAVIIGVPLLFFIIGCIWFTVTWFKHAKESSWYL